MSLTGPSPSDEQLGEWATQFHTSSSALAIPQFADPAIPHSLLTPEVLLDCQDSLSFSEKLFSLEPATDVLLYHNTTLPELIQSEFL